MVSTQLMQTCLSQLMQTHVMGTGVDVSRLSGGAYLLHTSRASPHWQQWLCNMRPSLHPPWPGVGWRLEVRVAEDMRISLVAAVSTNGVIGRDGKLPWRLKTDLRAFKARTLGHHVIVGRKTFESFGGRPLPGRPNIVVTRDPNYPATTGCAVVPSLEAALQLARNAGEKEAMVIGGAQIYALALPLAHLFYRTHVLASVEGDVFFPSFDVGEWDRYIESAFSPSEHDSHAFVIERLSRRAPWTYPT